MARKTRILVTGSSGFIGARLVRMLSEKSEFLVFRATRFSTSNVSENEVIFDLTDVTSILRLVDSYSFDVIVHLAAKVGWGGMPYEEMYVENVLATGALGVVAKKMGASLIFGSAALVHGQTTSKISPDSPEILDTDYARTKYEGEVLLKSILPSVCILRIGGVFGKNGPNHLGLNRAISGALQGEVPVIYGDGEFLRNYIFVDDLCNQIVEAVRMKAAGTYLIAGSERLSIKAMIEAVCEEFLSERKPLFIASSQAGFDQVITASDRFGKAGTFSSALAAIGCDSE